MDKIGEVIGPKGKVINTIQQETGADIAVDDDGVGRHGHDRFDRRPKVAEARRQIELIINPPTAKVGEIYTGRVVNITKFGAFVNILPGRDGLVHISKLGRGKRINRVEDVLDLGDEVTVRVDDIDPNGKVSLTPVGPEFEADGDGERPRHRRASAPHATRRPASPPVCFEDAFDSEAREVYGDLGPSETAGVSQGRDDRRRRAARRWRSRPTGPRRRR